MAVIELDIDGRKHFHNCVIIDQLPVPCILGMDFLSKVEAVIETTTYNISFSNKPHKLPRKFKLELTNNKPLTLTPYSENDVKLSCLETFFQGLIESSQSLPDQVMVMDGITTCKTDTCVAIVSNFSLLPVKLPAQTPIAHISVDQSMTIKPLAQCLTITLATPNISDTSHVDSIDLKHIPVSFKPRYRELFVVTLTFSQKVTWT